MVVTVFMNWMQSFLLDNSQQPQQEEELLAVPGLVTLLDQAMLDTVQPQLTATLTALHALLAAWLDLKRMAKHVLSASHNSSTAHAEEGVVARVCFDAACDAVERLSTDRLAAFGNLSDPFESISPATTSSTLQSTTGTTATDPSLTSTNQSTHGTSLTTTAATWLDSARRQALPQRGRDCWETAILHCPDYVWADDVVLTCLRLIRHLQKTLSNSESFLHTNHTNNNAFSNRLIHSIQDLVTAVHKFKTSIEADAVVLKRLYLIKCEYRGPLRAFWEAHQAVQRAPALQWVDSALQQRQRNSNIKGHDDDQGTLAKQRLQKLLERPELVESLALEQACERFEVEMAKTLYSFAEVARHYGKRTSSSTRNHNHGGHMMARHADHPLVTPRVARTLRRLKKCLVRKTGPDTSGGIRPLLLDWQGVPRDDENDDTDTMSMDDPLQAFEARVTAFCQDLQAVSRLCELRLQQGSSSGSGGSSSWDSVLDTIPTTAARECVDLDAELLICQAVDWYACVLRQHELQDTPALRGLSEQVRKAELWLSLAMASEPSLTVVRQRIALIQADREKRFGICQEMVQQVCWREMNWKVRLTAPDPMTVLSLSSTNSSSSSSSSSSKGVLQIPLTRAGETIPLG